ncbi:MAG: 4-hydroxy-tetrahydrodipicolinate synthase [Gammaproteobacteria bacterium WSBS_2016_MAG_OTU1]
MNTNNSRFVVHGSIVAIVTPMSDNGDIDTQSFTNLLEWHLQENTQGVVVAGTTGESPTLTLTENQRLIAQAVQWSNKRMPIIGGIGANSTAEAIFLTQQAAKDGADAGLSVVPYYNKPTQEGLYRHFSAIANCSDLPIILYDVPKRCVSTFTTDTLARLAAHPNIIGIKDATGDIARLAEHLQVVPEDFLFYSGDDSTSTDYIIAGGHGVVSVTANIAPQQMHRVTAAARQGDIDTARKIDATLQPFHSAQSAESNPIPIKWALAESGRIRPSIRLPLTPLAPSYHQLVRDAVNHSQQESL